MDIGICKWYNNSDSPVLLMIDDLANVWIDLNGNGIIDLEEDWGYAKNNDMSSFRFLNEVVLADYPEVKSTFFAPMGPRVGMVKNPKFHSVSNRLDYDKETIKFFRDIHENPKFEVAYHGTTHGKVGDISSEFLQEWETYQSLEEAINTIKDGKEIYKKVFGCYPKGGKYCGYKSGDYGDESIDHTEFIWWSRYFNKGVGSKGSSESGEDYNKITNYDIKKFGKNEIIDIPSTVLGSIFNKVSCKNFTNIKCIMKFVFKSCIAMKKYEELEFLLNNKLIISIQEHISPARDDGMRQTPNIYDDKVSLQMIFDYLKDKNVWYCTGSELADYVLVRDNSKINLLSDHEFEIEFKNTKKLTDLKLSIITNKNVSKIIQPNDLDVYKNNNAFNIQLLKGTYKFVLD